MAGAAPELNEGNFAEVTGKGVTLVDFWAEWCPPCKMQGPVIEKLASDYRGRASVAKLDVDASHALAARFGVQSIPTLILFKDGVEVQRLVGLQTEEKLRSALDAALGG
jgi:thioredoxin 1